MPTYQYRCRNCDEFLEAFQKFSDDALTTCPACGEEQLRKVYNAVGVVFKGSGFYKTDHRNDSRKASSSSSGSSDSNGSGSNGSGSKGSDSSGSGSKESGGSKSSESKPKVESSTSGSAS